MTTTNNQTEQIRALNDQFRSDFDPNLGRVILTAGVQVRFVLEKPSNGGIPGFSRVTR